MTLFSFHFWTEMVGIFPKCNGNVFCWPLLQICWLHYSKAPISQKRIQILKHNTPLIAKWKLIPIPVLLLVPLHIIYCSDNTVHENLKKCILHYFSFQIKMSRVYLLTPVALPFRLFDCLCLKNVFICCPMRAYTGNLNIQMKSN